jgi:YD repeat-containing protein
MKLRIVFLASLLALGGCVSSGTQVTEDQANQFVRGRTTEAEVVAALGQPDSTTRSEDGSRIDAYTYVKASANAASFIPYVNILAGGSTAKYTTVAFTFDPNGRLKGWTSTSGKSDVNTGLLNQK